MDIQTFTPRRNTPFRMDSLTRKSSGIERSSSACRPQVGSSGDMKTYLLPSHQELVYSHVHSNTEHCQYEESLEWKKDVELKGGLNRNKPHNLSG
jgi:hypothetical protein